MGLIVNYELSSPETGGILESYISQPGFADAFTTALTLQSRGLNGSKNWRLLVDLELGSFHGYLWWILMDTYRNTLQETNIYPIQKHFWVDDFPFPKVGYVSSPGGVKWCWRNCRVRGLSLSGPVGAYPWISNLVCSDMFIAMSSHPLASGFDDQTCGICIAPFFHAWMAIGANTTIELAPTFKIWRTHAEYILIFPINVRLLPPSKNAPQESAPVVGIQLQSTEKKCN